MHEDKIKSKLIDLLIANNKDDVICSELPFADRHRRADIAIINEDYLTAYEIKSEADNLDKLPEQIIDYSNCFDYVYVVLSLKHLETAKQLVSRQVGIYVFENRAVKLIRVAKLRKRLDKRSILSMLTTNQLSKLLRNIGLAKTKKYQSKQMQIEGISGVLKLSEIRSVVRELLTEKYENRFRVFLNERGNISNIDDLPILSKQQPEELL